MWDKLKDQLPAVVITLVVIGGLAYWLHTKTVADMSAAQSAELATLREETNQQLQAAAEATRTQINDLNRMLSSAIEERRSDLFFNEEELAAANAERIDTIATALAAKIQPFDDIPQSPEEAARRETAQIDRVSDQLTARIQPLLDELGADTTASRETLQRISDEISDQLSIVLTRELARNQTLNDQLLESQSVARDTMLLAQEFGTLYVASKDTDGILTRLLTLPANVVKDATTGSIITSTERKQVEAELAEKMTDLQNRLDTLDAQIEQAE